MSVELLELLHQWPIQDEIHGAIRIAYMNAKKFAQIVALSSTSETNLYPFIYIDNSYLEIEVEYVKKNSATDFNTNNNSFSENEQLFNAAKEVAQVVANIN